MDDLEKNYHNFVIFLCKQRSKDVIICCITTIPITLPYMVMYTHFNITLYGMYTIKKKNRLYKLQNN
jgi:hypothetical protein